MRVGLQLIPRTAQPCVLVLVWLACAVENMISILAINSNQFVAYTDGKEPETKMLISLMDVHDDDVKRM